MSDAPPPDADLGVLDTNVTQGSLPIHRRVRKGPLRDPERVPSELIRALAAFAEPPAEEHGSLASLLDLPLPTRGAHTDLLVLELVPYASVYLDEAGWIGGEARDIVAGFWRAVGREAPDEPDHLTALLGLYAELSDVAPGAPTGARVGVLGQARRTLLAEHLTPWVFAYLAEVRNTAQSRSYRAWATSLFTVLAREAMELGGSSLMPLHLRITSPIEDPRAVEQNRATTLERKRAATLERDRATTLERDFLRQLLSPIRSGGIISRSRLTGLARGRGLGLRAGERHYVLRSLIAQDPAATFEWLAEHFLAAAGSHDEHAEFSGRAAVELGRRARLTAGLLREMARQTGSNGSPNRNRPHG